MIRRGLAALAAVLVSTGFGLGVLLAGAVAAPAGEGVRVVGPVGLTVGDMERSVAFYSRVLDFEKVSDMETPAADRTGAPGARVRVVRLRLGDEALELTQYLAAPVRPIPADSRSHDHWFQHVAIIASDMDAAYARLRAQQVQQVSPSPQRLPDWNPSAGGIRAFYFKDPDGHPLEILWFPGGKGAPQWQRPDGRLFLGIDHTAIVVADTERSLACYRDVLGLRVAGESENHGPEQERLNAVAGARLRITALRAAAGPGVELLEYLAPRDGRPAPADARPSDLAHWETTLVAADDAAARAATGSRACGASSPAAVVPAEPGPSHARGMLMRDPDGHVLHVVQP